MSGTTTYGYTGKVETLTIATTGTYEVTAAGATGGGAAEDTVAGGAGAEVVGDFVLNSGDVIQILVGQVGGEGTGVGEGGGGTFIYDETTGTLLEAAGGGGGASGNSYSPNEAGQAGTSGANGTNAPGYNGGGGYGMGGTGGSGGTGTNDNGNAGGGGGGGFLTAGGNGVGNGGDSFSNIADGNDPNGGTGGESSNFGDGGSGGGGGYSGGGGGGYDLGASGDMGGAGGGGGSYDSGTNQTITAGENAAGNGFASIEQVICYLEGSHILTRTGEVQVEKLRVGNVVATRFGGFRPIKWIGWQSYNARFLSRHRGRVPVQIQPGALGRNVPAAVLSVSPGHSMLLENRLVLASALVNGITVTQSLADAPDCVRYFQIELDTHDCVMAEGAWSETYADAPGMRAQFHNAAEYAALYPEEATPEVLIPLCAPRPEGGPELDAALRPVVARAVAGQHPGALEGYIDIASPTLIDGWAMDASHPDLPILLELYAGETLLGTILACDHRRDLLDAGKGNGNHAFSFTPNSPIPADELGGLSITRAADSVAISPHGREKLALAG